MELKSERTVDMETYWDAFIGAVARCEVKHNGEVLPRVEDMTPRELLKHFYWWLEEKGQLVH